jgi:hypothetical protein
MRQGRTLPLFLKRRRDMSIRKYGRYLAVYTNDGALICLTVYHKGAAEVVRRLQQALEATQQGQETDSPAMEVQAQR